MDLNEKQLQIIDTAERLFADKGFEGTSVRDIAEEAKINVAMISYYFGSKEKLLETLFAVRAEGTVQKLESMLKDTLMNPLQKVNVMIDYFIDKFQKQNCFYKILMREQVAVQRTATSELIQHFKKRNQKLVKQLIHEGQKTGEFSKNVDVPMLMTTLIGTAGHLMATQHFYKEINNLQEMPDEQFQKLIKKKLSSHLKFLFKATLTHEV
ncbi:MAG: TetR family transcriptional regulator [Ferruginibacter sp.]